MPMPAKPFYIYGFAGTLFFNEFSYYYEKCQQIAGTLLAK